MNAGKMEKFNYRNFGKFINEIISNPEVVKKRDFLAEKAFSWFEVSEDEIKIIDKKNIIKDLYKYISLSYYIIFKDNEDNTKTDILSLKGVEKEFPAEVYFLNKNTENWQYLLTYYSGIIDALSSIIKLKDGRNFKTLINLDNDESND